MMIMRGSSMHKSEHDLKVFMYPAYGTYHVFVLCLLCLLNIMFQASHYSDEQYTLIMVTISFYTENLSRTMVTLVFNILIC